MITVGWALAALPVLLFLYAYGVYPFLLRILARDRPLAERTAGYSPVVSVVIPAYNEEAQIRGAIEAVLAQDYPADRIQLLILSDASTDRTDEIVTAYAPRGVELMRMAVRGGKTAAENASCALLRGEIIVNSDSSIRLHRSAIRLLVEAMTDPQVGVASTRDVSIATEAETANAAEAEYVGYEMQIRALETRTGGIVGASGSGYAIRAALHRIPVRADLSRDFSAALTARTNGYTAVSVDGAICYVPRTASIKVEYRRKVRTIARGVETLLFNQFLLDPMDYGLFSWKLWSHKVCRWMVPVTAIPGAIGVFLLAAAYGGGWIVVAAGVAGAAVAALGVTWPSSRPMPRLLSVATFAVAANVAVVHAFARVIWGSEDHVWEPTRRTPALFEEPTNLT